VVVYSYLVCSGLNNRIYILLNFSIFLTRRIIYIYFLFKPVFNQVSPIEIKKSIFNTEVHFRVHFKKKVKHSR